jgi:hypothetical protein
LRGCRVLLQRLLPLPFTLSPHYALQHPQPKPSAHSSHEHALLHLPSNPPPSVPGIPAPPLTPSAPSVAAETNPPATIGRQSPAALQPRFAHATVPGGATASDPARHPRARGQTAAALCYPRGGELANWGTALVEEAFGRRGTASLARASVPAWCRMVCGLAVDCEAGRGTEVLQGVFRRI